MPVRGKGIGPPIVRGQRGHNRGTHRFASGRVLLARVFILKVVRTRRHRPGRYGRGCHGVVEYKCVHVSLK